MDTKALRQKILDLAIRGKLVPQDPNDEPAEVLLERIREQKQQMFKEGKLKKKDIKNDTIIFKGEDNLHYEKFQDGTVKCIEDEIPFELPEGWEWARLKDLLNVCSSKRVLQSDWKNEGIPFYRAREIVKLSENDFIDNELFISEEHYLELKKNYGVPQSGDLMVSSVGTIGKVYIVKPEDLFYYKDASVLCFENKNKLLVSQFAKILLESSFVQSQMRDNSKGTTVDTITISAATNYLCIVPPKNEQLRIVDAAQRALVKVIQIQSNKDVLQATITNAKSKILDLAIRGKLVPQDPNDEPASVLLERIRAEKEGLIKQGKIKRDKKDSVIFKGDDNSYYEKVGNKLNCIDEEISFKLPEGWAFIRLKTAWELISGRDLSPSDYNDKNDGIPYITGASNFKNGHVSLVRWTPVPQVITQKGDLLLTCKGTIGEIAYNNFGKAHIARQIMAIRNNYSLNVDFLALCIEYSMTKIKQAAKGLIPGISREDILNLVIPIPPTKEQEKICDKLKVTFSAIKHIEKAS